MLKARTNHASAALNGEIYAIGGKASLPACPGHLLLVAAPAHLSAAWEPPNPATMAPHFRALARDQRAPRRRPGLRPTEACSPVPALWSSPSGVTKPPPGRLARLCHRPPGCLGVRLSHELP